MTRKTLEPKNLLEPTPIVQTSIQAVPNLWAADSVSVGRRTLFKPTNEEDSLIELSFDQTLKSFFTTSLIPFIINVRQQYPEIDKLELRRLMKF
ncbi:hypothetical protein AVEN_150152-1 [Araneus ventricosus]|uniref:Uncharacterized protein n=1 Tax=Araneus ventricosus TaxID=182803 RepID=A0A4Y2KVV9_ARAVE|nr:hypothetical protein AVEN_150152-1 [Araneus ventricosus]